MRAWIRSSYQEADLGVTLSEVRPDGSETYIQSGVLRGTHRRTTPESTPLLPLMSGLEQDAEPLPTDEFVEARVEIFPFAHVVREGSRHPSKLVLPLVPTVTGYPEAVPENCQALRAQPCRDFEEYTNTPAG